VALKIMLII